MPFEHPKNHVFFTSSFVKRKWLDCKWKNEKSCKESWKGRRSSWEIKRRNDTREKDGRCAGKLTCTEPCLSAGVNVPPAPDCFTVSGHVAPTPLPPPPPTPPPANSWRNKHEFRCVALYEQFRRIQRTVEEKEGIEKHLTEVFSECDLWR